MTTEFGRVRASIPSICWRCSREYWEYSQNYCYECRTRMAKLEALMASERALIKSMDEAWERNG